MTNQEAFEKVAHHLLSLKEPSVDKGQCKYRARNGNKCAIGILIPDEQYDPAFEDKSVHGLRVPCLENLSRSLLSSLQRTHESFSMFQNFPYAPPNILARLHQTGERHGLNTEFLGFILRNSNNKSRSF